MCQRKASTEKRRRKSVDRKASASLLSGWQDACRVETKYMSSTRSVLHFREASILVGPALAGLPFICLFVCLFNRYSCRIGHTSFQVSMRCASLVTNLLSLFTLPIYYCPYNKAEREITENHLWPVTPLDCRPNHLEGNKSQHPLFVEYC